MKKCYHINGYIVSLNPVNFGYDAGIYTVYGQTVKRRFCETEEHALKAFYRFCKQAKRRRV